MGNTSGTTRTRWAAIGAAVAITLGGGGVGIVSATMSSGDKPVFVSIEPTRILDTRNNVGLTGRFADAVPRDLQVTGSVPVAGGGARTVVPAGATGVALNVTVVNTSSDGFLSVRPSGATGEPLTSNVNFVSGQIVPNAVNVDLPANGRVQIWFEAWTNGGTSDVLVDVVGYYDDHHHDDRYYTKTQIDANKVLSLNVYANPDINFVEDVYGDNGDAGVGGLNVDVDWNFTVPPDHTAGTPMTVRVLAYSRTATTCNGDISANSTFVARAGASPLSAGLTPANIPRVFTAARVPQEYIFTLGGSLRAGDAVSFGLFALAPSPRCDLVITGMSILYT